MAAGPAASGGNTTVAKKNALGLSSVTVNSARGPMPVLPAAPACGAARHSLMAE